MVSAPETFTIVSELLTPLVIQIYHRSSLLGLLMGANTIFIGH